MRPEKKRTNAWLWPEQETTNSAGENRALMELKEIDDDHQEELPQLKRSKPSSPTPNKWLLEYHPSKEPKLLHLKLDKSPSFLEIIEKRLNDEKRLNEAIIKNDVSFPKENLQVQIKKKNIKARVGISDPIDKLKASNFPALLLKIGDWEYESRNEGDLVAKCYFAKHKLVWEVLHGGLKNKIEIQWEDIVSLKANLPENGPGTLIVMLGKEPLFFRETNPVPRKHTIWQPTADFTSGQAARRFSPHYLQCAQGVLNKPYEKLIHCDTRLNFLSQQFHTFLDKPFPETSIKPPNDMVLQPTSHGVLNGMVLQPISQGVLNGMVLQPTSQCHYQDSNFPHNDIWNNNMNSWQDRNYYSSPGGMVSSSTSQCLLMDANSNQEDTSEDIVNPWQEGNNYPNLVSNLPSDDDSWTKQGWEDQEFGNVYGYKQDVGMSRRGSYADLLSLPHGFLFDVFEDEKIL